MREELRMTIGAQGLSIRHAEVREFLDVGTGHEGFGAATGDDEHADVRVGFGFVQRTVQFIDRVAVQRIELVGAVDGDDADGTIVGDEEVGVGHGVWSVSDQDRLADLDRNDSTNVSATDRRGSATKKLVPSPSVGREPTRCHQHSPRCVSPWPSPSPMPLLLVVKLGVKMRSRDSSGMPTHCRCTSTTATASLRSRSAQSIRPSRSSRNGLHGILQQVVEHAKQVFAVGVHRQCVVLVHSMVTSHRRCLEHMHGSCTQRSRRGPGLRASRSAFVRTARRQWPRHSAHRSVAPCCC